MICTISGSVRSLTSDYLFPTTQNYWSTKFVKVVASIPINFIITGISSIEFVISFAAARVLKTARLLISSRHCQQFDQRFLTPLVNHSMEAAANTLIAGRRIFTTYKGAEINRQAEKNLIEKITSTSNTQTEKKPNASLIDEGPEENISIQAPQNIEETTEKKTDYSKRFCQIPANFLRGAASAIACAPVQYIAINVFLYSADLLKRIDKVGIGNSIDGYFACSSIGNCQSTLKPVSWIINLILLPNVIYSSAMDNFLQFKFYNSFHVVVLGPACEEIFYRKIVPKALATIAKPFVGQLSDRASLILTSFQFGALHWRNHRNIPNSWIRLVGIVLPTASGMLYSQLNNMWGFEAGLGAHMMNNSIGHYAL